MEERPEPSVRELHERLTRLEKASSRQNDHIRQLLREIRALKADHLDLGNAFKSEVAHRSDHTRSIYKYLAEIHDHLWPLVHKVFPGTVKTQQQIATIMKNGGRSWDDKSRP